MGRKPRQLLFASTILAGSILALPAFAGTIAGNVNDATSTRGLGGAQVEVVELGRTAQTSSDGAFRFADVPAGQYTLRTTYAGASPTDIRIDVTADGTATPVIAYGQELEELLVIGQRAMLASSISRQRAADGVSSVVTRDAIGQFPDQNVAEAARRMTGINVLNDQGEGRFIAVRGLDPSLNAASVNGTRLPSPEADTRSVALDVIASELVESIEIKKTLTPDMDADTIGASIEINTTKAFDRKDPFFSGTVEGSYNDLNEKVSPKVGVDFSYPFSDRFGIAGGFSYNKRKTSTDNMEMDGWDETDEGIVYADEVQYRDYDVTRTRWGGSLSLDFRVDDSTTLYARGLYSQFDDREKRGRLTFGLDEEPTSGTDTTATFLSDDGEIAIERDIKDRFEAQTIQSYEVGGETFADAWTFTYKASYSKADEHEHKTQDPTRFTYEVDEPGQLGITFDYSDLHVTTFDVIAGETAFLDPTNYEFDKVENVDGKATDEEWAFRFDIARDFALNQGDLQIKAGGKARLRAKEYSLMDIVQKDFDGDYTLADVLGMQTYGLADIEPIPGLTEVRAFYEANESLFETDDFDTEYESAAAFFSVDEDIYAGYAMARLDTGRMVLIGGARLEHTEDDVLANQVLTVEEGGILDGDVVDEDTLVVTPNGFKNSYTDILPSASLRFDATDDVVLRAGVFKSVVRPGPEQISPRFLIEENDEGDREGEFGNPDLKPYRAWNFDVSAEYYFAQNAVVQIGGFYKTVENFIVDAEYEEFTFNGIYADEAVIPINGDKAKIKGVEFNYQHALTMLPGALDGLLVGFNYTYTDATGTVDGRKIPLPASSKNNFNASLGYEKGPISLRATVAYRDEYLDKLGGDPEEDRYVKDHMQWDFTAKYKINDYIRLYGELVNLNDEPYVAFQKGPKGDRLLQYETYSWTGKLGVKATF
jgi:TonB-dependent receptor